MQDVYEFTITGKCIPKARPRFSGHAYTPIKYKEWKDNAVKQLSQQYQGQPLTDCSIRIVFYGKHRGDLDNLAGSVLDALTQSKIIRDDSLKHVKHLEIIHQGADCVSVQVALHIICN